MATKLHFSSQANSAPISRALDANWDDVAEWIASRAIEPGRSAFFAQPGDSLTVNKDTGANTDIISGQFTSQPLQGDQTISGTVDMVVKVSESVATADAFMQLVIRVVDERGGTVRGTLFSGQVDTSVVATPGANNEEFPTTIATRILSGLTLTPVAALDTDRLVIEVGTRGTVAGTGSDFHHRWGYDEGAADYALTSGLTTTLNPWIEFSQDLEFIPQGPPTRNKILSIGDSLQAAFNSDLITDLTAAGWGGVVCDGLGGRFIWSPGTAAFRSYAVLSFYRNIGASDGGPFEPFVWVVQLGTNDVRTQAAANHQGSIDKLLALIDEAPGPKKIFWVNCVGDDTIDDGTPPGGTGGTFATFNGKLVTTAGARSDMVVLDWAAYAIANGDASWWDNGDGLRVHMTSLGYTEKRNWLVGQLAGIPNGEGRRSAAECLNLLAGTDNLTEAGAANALAGTTGLTLAGALNAHAGTMGLSEAGAANTLAGTRGLSLTGALNALAAGS